MLTNRLLKLQDVCLRLLSINLFAGRHCGSVSYRTACLIMSLVTLMPLTVAFCVLNVANMDTLTDGRCSLMIGLLALYKVALILSESQVSADCQIIDRINRREQFFSGLYASCFSLAAASVCLLPLMRALMSAPSSGQPELRNSLHMSLTLNRLFRPLINIQFLVASLLLCVLSYQLSENLAQLEVLHYAAFTLAHLAQIFLYCHCGEHLKEQSQQCTWQPLKLTMMRAQRGYRIDGHFGDIHVVTTLNF
ncbi:LOW QUALITY PROTEIN: uncharacterized protein Dmoj_GI16931 [Drosophila mojavensis]|uniref:Odorant receptor n=1 Tax=Drosophila mojavensis TaxID=7230 RepID=B4K6Y9_DROMO|nr:LOW QUALITY PROTEIN: uncharacterized protein Dmoj_GI16931 [Drosophila mojavensis]